MKTIDPSSFEAISRGVAPFLVWCCYKHKLGLSTDDLYIRNVYQKPLQAAITNLFLSVNILAQSQIRQICRWNATYLMFMAIYSSLSRNQRSGNYQPRSELRARTIHHYLPGCGALLDCVLKNSYTVTMLLETHTHGDHLSAPYYIQQTLWAHGQPHAQIYIQENIKIVQAYYAHRYRTPKGESRQPSITS